MNIKTESSQGKLFDFSEALLLGYVYSDITKAYGEMGSIPSPEVVSAYEFIWVGLDKKTPGLETLLLFADKKQSFFEKVLMPTLWTYKSGEAFLQAFEKMGKDELKRKLLAFFDKEDHEEDYYRDIIDGRSKLYDFIFALNLPSNVKYELLGYVTSPDRIMSSLLALFRILQKRIDEVYDKNSDTIERLVKKAENSIINKEDPLYRSLSYIFTDNEDDSLTENLVISVSFLNELAAKTYMCGCDVFLFLGINYESTLTQMPLQDALAGSYIYFKALGDDLRMTIVRMLKEKEMYIGEIASALDMPLTTLTHHIEVLRVSGVIRFRNEGKKVFCSIDEQKMDEIAVMISRYLGTNSFIAI